MAGMSKPSPTLQREGPQVLCQHMPGRGRVGLGSKGSWKEKLTPGQVLQGDIIVKQEVGGMLREGVEVAWCDSAAAQASGL